MAKKVSYSFVVTTEQAKLLRLFAIYNKMKKFGSSGPRFASAVVRDSLEYYFKHLNDPRYRDYLASLQEDEKPH